MRELSQTPSAIKQREMYAADPNKHRQRSYLWRKLNPELANKWQKDNREKINARHVARRSEDPEKYRARSRKSYIKNIEKRLVTAAQQRAKRFGIECDISPRDVVIPATCPVLGIPIVIASGRMADNSPTIDKIDPLLGYTKENIIVVSWRANRLKSDATLDEMKALVSFYEAIVRRFRS